MTQDETGDDASDDRPTREERRVNDGDVSAFERDLTARGDPYVRVTVVRREPPVSANVGDKAVVTPDGTLHGWIGGVSCAQSAVRQEARDALQDGEPRFIGISPNPEELERDGIEAFPMRCHSEGVLELFVEPVNATTQLLVVGGSPVARSLARLADELALDVTLVDPDGGGSDLPDATSVLTDSDPEPTADAVGTGPLVVVASMGQFDARGVAAALLADARYVGLVASETRADAVAERAAGLLDRDPTEVRAALTTPAGADIGAHTPAEIAVSLLAELVAVRGAPGGTAVATTDMDDAADSDETDEEHEHSLREGGCHHAESDEDRSAPEQAVDPVCGMAVEPTDDAPQVEHEGETYYFCCPGCADAFENDPASYRSTEASP